jgi:hypothetical protein
MNQRFFRGPLGVVFAICFFSFGATIALLILLGGSAAPPRDGNYFLSDHGQLTQVTRTAWRIAYVGESAILAEAVLLLLTIAALFGYNAMYADADTCKDHSRLVGASALLCLLLPIAASFATRLIR